MDRRTLLSGASAVAALAAAGPAAAAAARQARRFGIQLFSLPKMLEQDYAKAIAFLAGLGYREVETYGPYTFSDPVQIENWKRLEPSLGFSGSGFFGRSLAEARQILLANGMTAPSMHTDLFTLDTRMGPLADAAHQLGATYVTLPSLPADRRKSLDDYKRSAELFNKIGADAAARGVKFAYHNHGYGLKPVDGQRPIELLLNATDPARVFLEMDIYWTTAGGADPVELLTRYRGRYKMIHLKDMKGVHRFDGDGGGSDQWIKLFPYMTTLGSGAIDLKAILAKAEETGVEHYFVEQDTVANPEVALAASAAYLKRAGFA